MAATIIPLGRAAQPEEAAAPVLFLASPLSNYVHGQVINVTGGQFGGMYTLDGDAAMGRISDKLAELGLELPAPVRARRPASSSSSSCVRVSGGTAYVSGHGPLDGTRCSCRERSAPTSRPSRATRRRA